MASRTDRDVADAAQTLSERSDRFVGEITSWIENHSADILLALIAALLISLVMIGLRGFGRRLVRERGRDIDWRTIFGRVASKTGLFFIFMCAVQLVVSQTSAPHPISRTVEVLFVVAAAFQAAVWGRELVLGLVYQRVGEAQAHSTLGSAIGIIRLLVTVTLFAIALILILDNLGVNVTGLVAGLGIGGIAIGLAAQGIFSDLFAALSIIFDRPFRRGDAIRVGTVVGIVENIGLKTTRIRSFEGEEIVISNAKLLDQQLHNLTNLERRRFRLVFGLVYQTPPDTVAEVAPIARAVLAPHSGARFIRCGLTGFGASSLDFEFVFEIEGADYEQAFATRNAIALDLLQAFECHGISFAYPTQISFTAAPDGTLVMPYPEAAQDLSRHPGEGRDPKG